MNNFFDEFFVEPNVVPMEMSESLSIFYSELLFWVDNGCPDHKEFKTRYGICDNLKKWANKNLKNYPDRQSINHELKTQFLKNNLSESYPFGSMERFIKQMDSCELYKDKTRLKWIRDHAKR